MKAPYSPRKYWGVFCPIEQHGLPLYVHEIHPTAASGIIEEDNGTLREMTPPELDETLEEQLRSSVEVKGACQDAIEAAKAIKH